MFLRDVLAKIGEQCGVRTVLIVLVEHIMQRVVDVKFGGASDFELAYAAVYAFLSSFSLLCVRKLLIKTHATGC